MQLSFRHINRKTVYVSNAGDPDYLGEAGIKESSREIAKYLSMPCEMIPQVAEYCQKQNIQFMPTPFSVGDGKAVDPYVKIYKGADHSFAIAPA